MRWRKEKDEDEEGRAYCLYFSSRYTYLSYLTLKVFLSMMRETVEVLSPAREVDILYLLFLGTMYLLLFSPDFLFFRIPNDVMPVMPHFASSALTIDARIMK